MRMSQRCRAAEVCGLRDQLLDVLSSMGEARRRTRGIARRAGREGRAEGGRGGGGTGERREVELRIPNRPSGLSEIYRDARESSKCPPHNWWNQSARTRLRAPCHRCPALQAVETGACELRRRFGSGDIAINAWETLIPGDLPCEDF